MKINFQNIFGKNAVICCRKCHGKLRVPTDKGKILVTCPVCRKEFMFKPGFNLQGIKDRANVVIWDTAAGKRKPLIYMLIALVVILLVYIFTSH